MVYGDDGGGSGIDVSSSRIGGSGSVMDDSRNRTDGSCEGTTNESNHHRVSN